MNMSFVILILFMSFWDIRVLGVLWWENLPCMNYEVLQEV